YLVNFWKPFFLTGTFGLAVLAVLAATSNDFSVRRLRYQNWKWIHRAVYLATLALVWHVGTAGKGNWPFAQKVFVPLLALQVLRLGKPLCVAACQRWRRRHQWTDWREFEIVSRSAESEAITSFQSQPTEEEPDGRARARSVPR